MPRRTYRYADQRVYAFWGEFLVVCPRCQEPATTRLVGQTRSLSCPACGLTRGPERRHEEVSHRQLVGFTAFLYGAPVDLHFGLPLWIQTDFRGEVLWAYNWEHLAFLEDTIAAELRPASELRARGLHNKLPEWMLRAKNRQDLLRAIRKLRAKKIRRV